MPPGIEAAWWWWPTFFREQFMYSMWMSNIAVLFSSLFFWFLNKCSCLGICFLFPFFSCKFWIYFMKGGSIFLPCGCLFILFFLFLCKCVLFVFVHHPLKIWSSWAASRWKIALFYQSLYVYWAFIATLHQS